jgi:cell wall-associated NlpC family hydrolase
MSLFDPRVVPMRLDLAARILEGHVEAPRFADPHLCQVQVPTVMMRKAPDPEAEAVSQLLYGEPFDAYEESDGWVWGQSKVDDYVGYIRADSLSTTVQAATHRVAVAHTLAFSRPSIKSAVRHVLPFNARVTADAHEDRFVLIPDMGWVIAAHLKLASEHERDPAQLAELFSNATYLWGGREPMGCDCSGLVQSVLLACGIRAPRDSDMQEAQLGHDVAYGPNFSGLARNDLVFWSGHVGIMRDAHIVVHANAFFMGVTAEPLTTAVDRISRTAGPVTRVKRLTP